MTIKRSVSTNPLFLYTLETRDWGFTALPHRLPPAHFVPSQTAKALSHHDYLVGKMDPKKAHPHTIIPPPAFEATSLASPLDTVGFD